MADPKLFEALLGEYEDSCLLERFHLSIIWKTKLHSQQSGHLPEE